MQKNLELAGVLLLLLLFGCTPLVSAPSGQINNDINATRTDGNAGNVVTMGVTAKLGDSVSVDYTGKLTDGTVFDSSVGRQPLSFVVGEHQVISGFEDAVMGMAIGEKKTVELPPEEAYGEHDPSKVLTIDKNRFGDFNSVQVGSFVYAGTSGGKVVKKTDASAVIDFNPELAGKTLVFEITLVSIN